MPRGQFARNGGAFLGCRGRKGKKMKTDPDLVQYFRKYDEWDLIKKLIKLFKRKFTVRKMNTTKID